MSENLEEMYRIRKHYLILTEAGKFVYSRHGNQMTLSPFVATISAIIDKLSSFFNSESKVHFIATSKF